MVFARPRTLAAALEALEAAPDATLLGGGTDLLVEVQEGRALGDDVVALRRIDELGGVAVSPAAVALGSGMTWSAMEHELAGLLPALAAAARAVGSPQARNAGTLGGNLGTASTTASTLPVLAALDAEVVLAGPSGTRRLPLARYVLGPGRVARRPGELVRHVSVPRVRGPQRFLKVGARGSIITAVAQCALVLDLDRREVRCGLGAVGPVPVRPTEAERFAAQALDWSALRADDDVPRRFGELAAGACDPPSDLHASAAYRRHAAAVLAERALRRSLAA